MQTNTRNEVPKSQRHSGSQLPLWLTLAWTDLRSARGFAVSFIVSLSLGLTGFLVVDAVQRSFGQHLAARSKNAFGADLAVTSSRPLSPEEERNALASLPAGTATRHEQGMFSMVATDQTSRLVEVRAVDQAFPYYGTMQLERAGLVGHGHSAVIELQEKRLAWVYPELLIQLDIKIGSSLRIGELSFTVADVIRDDPMTSTTPFAIAPKVFVGLAHMAQTGLVQKGSRIFYGIYAKVPTQEDQRVEERLLEDTVKSLRSAVPASDVRMRTHRGATEELSRMTGYLDDYLGLVALVALFLAAVGAGFLFRGHLNKSLAEVAILLSLGASHRLARGIYVAQLAILGTLASLLSLALAGLILPVMPIVMRGLLPASVKLALHPEGALLALFMAVGASILCCLPLLVRMRQVQPATLFQESAQPKLELSRKQLLWWIPALLAYWVLAVLQVRSLRVGSVFVGIFLASGVVLAALGLAGTKLLNARLTRRHAQIAPAAWLAGLYLARQRAATLTSFLAIALSTMLVSVVPQVRRALQAELEHDPSSPRPALFLFDIQDEQVKPLAALLNDLGSPLVSSAAMVRARLTTINGEPSEKRELTYGTREEEEDQRARNRSYNLTYRDELTPTETLVEGRPFQGSYDAAKGGPAEVSLEQRFARRLGLGIGDLMGFDVQGVPIEAVVVSLRHVKWTSFQPNFFVQFQSGVLEEAPKTFVASIGHDEVLGTKAAHAVGTARAEAEQDFARRKVTIQTKVVQAFPNISIVDVGTTIRRILEIVEQMSVAVLFMAILSLLAGIAVLFAIARHQAAQRMSDMALLKALGASFADVRGMTLREVTGLAGAAAATGAAISILVTWGLMRALFDRLFVLDLTAPFFASLAVALLAVLTGTLATARALRTAPAALLGRT